jgi:hypothetical protein
VPGPGVPPGIISGEVVAREVMKKFNWLVNMLTCWLLHYKTEYEYENIVW